MNENTKEAIIQEIKLKQIEETIQLRNTAQKEIIQAIKLNDIEKAIQLLKTAPQTIHQGAVPILMDHWCHGRQDLTPQIIEHGNYDQTNPQLALIAWASIGQTERVTNLLKAGADPNTQIATCTPLERAVHHNVDTETTKALIHFGVDLKSKGMKMLCLAITRGSTENFQVLIEAKVLDHKKNFKLPIHKSQDSELLSQAIEVQQPKMVKLLLDNGVNASENAEKMLTRAINTGDEEIINLILEQVESHIEQPEIIAEALSISNQPERLAKYLNEHSEKFPDETHSFEVAVTHACRRGHEECLKILIQNGADITQEGQPIIYAIIYAIKNDNEGTLKILINNGADPTANDHYPLRTEFSENRTQYLKTIFKGYHYEVLKELLVRNNPNSFPIKEIQAEIQTRNTKLAQTRTQKEPTLEL